MREMRGEDDDDNDSDLIREVKDPNWNQVCMYVYTCMYVCMDS
jgi:hypothetical protein